MAAIPTLFWVICLFSWVYSLRFGGWLAAWHFVFFSLAMVGTTWAVPDNAGIDAYSGVNWPLFATDTAYFFGIILLMLFSRRYWPVWAAGLQLCCVLSHVPPMLVPAMDPALYRLLESFWQVPIMIAMVLGIMQDRRHDRRLAAAHEPARRLSI